MNQSHNYPWFDNVRQQLEQSEAQQRLGHGWLIAAPEGSGKSHFALDLVASIFCLNSVNITTPACGNCKSCQLLAAKTHPDFYYLDKLVDSKGKQKQSIGIDQIRELTAKLSDAAQLSGWRIATISSVSALTTAAFNALLKTLEEPGDRTLLFLLADNVQRVPATIRSRCQILAPNLDFQKGKTWLRENSKATEADINLALNLSVNAPVKALHRLESDELTERRVFSESMDALLMNQLTPENFAEQLSASDVDAWIWLNDYLVMATRHSACKTGPELYQSLPSKVLFNFYQKVIDYQKAVQQGSNLQAKMQFQSILIQWYEFGKKLRRISMS